MNLLDLTEKGAQNRIWYIFTHTKDMILCVVDFFCAAQKNNTPKRDTIKHLLRLEETQQK